MHARATTRTPIARALATASLVAVSGLLATAVPATAQWGGEARIQMGFGGDELASVEYSDGTQSDLTLGTYFSFLIGPSVQAWSSGASSLELQAMLGWAGWATGPENTEDRLKLNRFPVELLAFYGYRFPNRDMMLRIGGGATYHIGGGVSGSGALDGYDLDIDNALGGTGEAGLAFGIVTTGVRYTYMKPAIEGLPDPMDGSQLAFFVGIMTPR